MDLAKRFDSVRIKHGWLSGSSGWGKGEEGIHEVSQDINLKFLD